MRASAKINPATQGLWVTALLSGIATTLIDKLISTLATPLVYAPPEYPSFSWLPLFAGCMIGALGACAVLLFLERRTRQPIPIFYRVAAVVMIVSYSLPILPLVNPLPRFAGVNWEIALTLMGMHTITAIIIVQTLVAVYKSRTSFRSITLV